MTRKCTVCICVAYLWNVFTKKKLERRVNLCPGCKRLKPYWISVLCGMARDQAKWFCPVVIVTACCVRSFFVFLWLSHSLWHSLMLQPYKIPLCVTVYRWPTCETTIMCNRDTNGRPPRVFECVGFSLRGVCRCPQTQWILYLSAKVNFVLRLFCQQCRSRPQMNITYADLTEEFTAVTIRLAKSKQSIPHFKQKSQCR